MQLFWLTAKLLVFIQSEAGIINVRQVKMVNHTSFNWVSVENTLEVSPPAGLPYPTKLILADLDKLGHIIQCMVPDFTFIICM